MKTFYNFIGSVVIYFLLLFNFFLMVQALHKAFRTFDDPHFKKFLNLKNSSTFIPLSSIPLPKLRQYSYYGESCTSSEDCAPNLGLGCVDSTCLCITPDFIARLNPDKSIRNYAKTECVLRAGSNCGIKLRNPASGILQRVTVRAFSSSIWNKIKKNIPTLIEGVGEHFANSDSHCVDNSHCIGGICKCISDYFKDSRGLCLKKRTLFQPCEESGEDECRSSEGLHCSQGKCQCKKSMIFDRLARKCFIPVGGECDAYSSNPEEYDMDCVRNAECSNARCVCLDGYTRSSDGTCGVAHGKSCNDKDKICSDIQLTCRSGQCQCRYPVHQVYNETFDECLSKPDGPCVPETMALLEGSLRQNCVPFAKCSWMEDTKSVKRSIFDYTCKCVEGFAEDQVGECVPSYASECSDDDDCDEVGQLSCVNGKCSCPDGMLTWDETRRKCVGLPGARCKFIQLERILSMKMDIPTECVENAVCMEHVAKLDGRCECQTGYQFSPNFMKCVKSSR